MVEINSRTKEMNSRTDSGVAGLNIVKLLHGTCGPVTFRPQDQSSRKESSGFAKWAEDEMSDRARCSVCGMCGMAICGKRMEWSR